MSDVNVTITANPEPFIAGMEAASAATTSFGNNAQLVMAEAQKVIAQQEKIRAAQEVMVIDTKEKAAEQTAILQESYAKQAEAERVYNEASAAYNAEQTARYRAVAAAAMERSDAIVQSERSIQEAQAVTQMGGRDAFLERMRQQQEEIAAARAEAAQIAAAKQAELDIDAAQARVLEVAAAQEANELRLKEAMVTVNRQNAEALREMAAAQEAANVSSRTSYELGVIISEMLSGNFARMQRSIAALANSTGLTKDLVTTMAALGAGVLSVVGVFAVLAAAQASASAETEKFNKAVESTGGIVGATGAQLSALASSIGVSIHDFGTAKEAVLALASSGRTWGESFNVVAQGVASLAELTGKSVQSVVAEFDKLGEDPVKNVVKLNEQYHFLTAEQYEEIAALQKLGDVTGAAEEAQRLLAETSIARLQRVQDEMPPLISLWYQVKAAAIEGWNAIGHIGDDSITGRIAEAASDLASAQLQLTLMSKVLGGAALAWGGWADHVEEARGRLNLLNAELAAQTNAQKDADRVAAEHNAEIIRMESLVAGMTSTTQHATDKIELYRQALVKLSIEGKAMPEGIVAGFNAVTGAVEISGATWDAWVEKVKRSDPAYRAAEEAAKKYAEAQKNASTAMEQANLYFDQQTTKVGGPVAEAWAKYNKLLDEDAKQVGAVLEKDQALIDAATTLEAKEQAKIKYTEDEIALGQRREEVERQALADTQAKIAALGDWSTIMQKIHGESLQALELDELSTQDRKIATEAIKLQTDALKLLHDQKGKSAQLTPQEIADLQKEAEWHVKTAEAIEQHKEAVKGLVSTTDSAFGGYADALAGFATRTIHSWSDLWKSLLQTTQQFVQQIIAQMLKLLVFNEIENSMFQNQAGYQMKPTMSSLGGFSGLFGGGTPGVTAAGTIDQDFLAGGELAGTGSSGGIMGGIGNWALGSGGSTGFFNTSMSSLMGSGGEGGSFAGAAGSMLGGAWGGYGLGSALTGGSKAGGIIGAGAGAAAAYFIPVVGWVLGAMALINQFTGGGLYGTQYAPTGETEADIGIGPGGASVQDFITESKKKPLFQGRSWKTLSQAGSPEQQAAADQMYKAVLDNVEAFAASVGQTAADVVSGTFKVATDKAGKQTFTSVVGGETFKGESQQQFVERVQAESFKKVLEDMGLDVDKFVNQFKGDADAYWKAVQDFATVTTSVTQQIAAGFKFMGVAGDQTIKSVMAFVEAQQQAGETLAQTYQRLAQAQQQYNQFVAQFIPGTRYVDSFEASFSQLYQQMLASIKTANDLAKAAGAAGASQEDLTNIQQAYAVQMAQLTAQLEASAQSLAFTLGVSMVGTLDQVNQAIQDIINAAKSAPDTAEVVTDTATSTNVFSVAVRNLGTTVKSTTKSVLDDINLLLGSLSTLNDQQKLQIALESLRLGTGATREQVLEIGQRLYASSEAYVTLFNEVMQYKDPTTGGGGGGRGGGGGGGHAASTSSATTTTANTPPKDWTDSLQDWIGTGLTQSQWNKMSDADKQKLLDLITQQGQLTAAKQHADFNNLATQIAEVSSASGRDVMSVMSDMKINLQALEKGLGLKSDAELKAYLEKIQSQQDSAGQNTDKIVTAINLLPRAIADAISGKPGGGRTATLLHPVTGTAPPDGSGDGGTISDSSANKIGVAVARSFTNVFAGPRNIRGR